MGTLQVCIKELRQTARDEWGHGSTANQVRRIKAQGALIDNLAVFVQTEDAEIMAEAIKHHVWMNCSQT